MLVHSLAVARRGEEGVHSDAEAAVQHVGDHSLEDRALGCLNAGVCVHLNKAHLEVFIQHEIVAEDLKAVHAALRVDQAACGPKSVRHYALNLRTEYVSLEVDPKRRECLA